MGHTHYWSVKNQLDSDSFGKAQKDCKTICDILKNKHDIHIQAEYNDDDPPLFGDNLIKFNGMGDDGCETFFISLYETGYSFCKTARQYYDLAVQCCLLILHHYFQENFVISSDGNKKDWNKAVNLVNVAFTSEYKVEHIKK